LISANLGIRNFAALVIILNIILKILQEVQDNSNWEVDSRSVNLSSPYQVINGENTNDAESLSSPLVTFWHCSASQT